MEWRAIEGYYYPYRISETARVQMFDNGKWIDISAKLHPTSRRVEVSLRREDGSRKNASLAHLMADAFMGGCKPGYNIIHKNGMKTDCEIENLAFATKYETGKKYGGTARRKPVLKVDKNGELLSVYPSAAEAGKANFISVCQVKKHCRGIIKNPFKFIDFTFCYDK